MPTYLTEPFADRFAGLALGHVTREYPNKLDHVMTGPEDVASPRQLHPIFFGSFDWHSCVHGYWMLARLRRLFPRMAAATQIDALFENSFTAENIAGELAYLKRPSSRGFERPYGWAWALMLAAELKQTRFGQAFHPLEREFVARFESFLPLQSYAIRTGTHNSTAFALALAGEYAAEDETFRTLLAARARAWYGADRDAQAWEPGGDDFLSPTLCEAAAMHRLLPAEDFSVWFDAFLPDLAQRRPAALFTPAVSADRSDGKLAHLDGLNLSRAWCMRTLAGAVTDARGEILRAAAETHLQAALPHVAGDYMGEHWLASFATLALQPND